MAQSSSGAKKIPPPWVFLWKFKKIKSLNFSDKKSIFCSKRGTQTTSQMFRSTQSSWLARSSHFQGDSLKVTRKIRSLLKKLFWVFSFQVCRIQRVKHWEGLQTRGDLWWWHGFECRLDRLEEVWRRSRGICKNSNRKQFENSFSCSQ